MVQTGVVTILAPGKWAQKQPAYKGIWEQNITKMQPRKMAFSRPRKISSFMRRKLQISVPEKVSANRPSVEALAAGRPAGRPGPKCFRTHARFRVVIRSTLRVQLKLALSDFRNSVYHPDQVIFDPNVFPPICMWLHPLPSLGIVPRIATYMLVTILLGLK